MWISLVGGPGAGGHQHAFATGGRATRRCVRPCVGRRVRAGAWVTPPGRDSGRQDLTRASQAGLPSPPCARWSSTRPGRRCARSSSPEPGPGPGEVADRGRAPAACAAPICTSSTASCRTRSCRSCPATRSSARGRRERRRRDRFAPGDRVGVPWLGWTCGACRVLPRGRENLCDRGPLHRLPPRRRLRRDAPSPTSASASPLPAGYADAQAAPLLCAGLIGYRALRAGRRRGAARPLRLRRRRAHRRARSRATQGRRVFAFTRAGRRRARRRSRASSARTGPARRDEAPPEPLDAAIIFAPVGALVPAALRAVAQGRHGRLRRHPHERHPVVPLRRSCGASGRVRSVANLTRARRRGVPGARAASPGPDRGDALPARRGRTRRSRTCAPGGSPARRCSCRRRPSKPGRGTFSRSEMCPAALPAGCTQQRPFLAGYPAPLGDGNPRRSALD